MTKIIKLIKKILFFINEKESFPYKREILNLNYGTPEIKEVIEHIVNNKIEDAIALYSTNANNSISINNKNNQQLCNLINKKEVLNKLSKHKDRYFEFFTSFFYCKDGVLGDALYKKDKDKIYSIQKQLLLNNNKEGGTNFFANRINEWKIIFKREEVPYLTKPILYKEIDKFNVKTDEDLFKGLISVTPLYFLRKMQMANMVEFIDLEKAQKHFEKGKKLKILDYGCGSADLSLYCAMNNHEVTICDIKGGNLDAAKKRFELRKLPVKTIGVTYDKPIPEIHEKFDIIIALEVIEHVRYPNKLLKQFNEALKNGGVIMLGSFPFNDTSATGDHLIEAVSQKKQLLTYINSNWKRLEQKTKANIFIKE